MSEWSEVKFKCPTCGFHAIEEVQVDVVVASEIASLTEDGIIDYGEQTNDGGRVVRYQCADCGFKIIGNDEAEDLDEVDLVEAIRKLNEEQWVIYFVDALKKIADRIETVRDMADIQKLWNRYFPDEQIEYEGDGFFKRQSS